MCAADCTPFSHSLRSTTRKNCFSDFRAAHCRHSSHAKVLLPMPGAPSTTTRRSYLVTCFQDIIDFNWLFDAQDPVNVSLQCETSEVISLCLTHLIFLHKSQLDKHLTRSGRELVRFGEWTGRGDSSQVVSIA